MTGVKTIVITGGNSGLGFECVRSVLRRNEGWFVIIACRDADRGKAAVKKLKDEFSESALVASRSLDLADLSSIRNFAELLAADLTLPPLYSVVCNAAVQTGNSLRFTRDGFEETFGVNHLGHFLLVNLLLSQIKKPGRVVVVSSGTHDPQVRTGLPAPAPIEPEKLAHPQKTLGGATTRGSLKSYSTSKLCNVMFAYELSRRLAGTSGPSIGVFAIDPGFMPGTGLAREMNPMVSGIAKHILPAIKPLIRLYTPNVDSPQGAGQKLAELAISDKYMFITGRYFEGNREAKSSTDSHNEELARLLWDESVRLVNLRNEEAPRDC